MNASRVVPSHSYLMKVKNVVGIHVFAGNRFCPQFLHEEDLVSELWHNSISSWTCFSNPVRQVTHKVEEKVSVWNTDHYNMKTLHNKYIEPSMGDHLFVGI